MLRSAARSEQRQATDSGQDNAKQQRLKHEQDDKQGRPAGWLVRHNGSLPAWRCKLSAAGHVSERARLPAS